MRTEPESTQDSLDAVIVTPLSDLQNRRTEALNLYVEGYITRTMYTRIVNRIEAKTDRQLTPRRAPLNADNHPTR